MTDNIINGIAGVDHALDDITVGGDEFGITNDQSARAKPAQRQTK